MKIAIAIDGQVVRITEHGDLALQLGNLPSINIARLIQKQLMEGFDKFLAERIDMIRQDGNKEDAKT